MIDTGMGAAPGLYKDAKFSSNCVKFTIPRSSKMYDTCKTDAYLLYSSGSGSLWSYHASKGYAKLSLKACTSNCPGKQDCVTSN